MTNIDMGDAGLDLGADGESEIRRVDGRSRAARQARATTRESARPALREGEVVGRNGEILSRRRVARSNDPFDTAGIVPPGWEYQWVAVTVAGDGDIVRPLTLQFHDGGFRPVPAERHDGKFMIAGTKGAIIYGGQMLMERPVMLGEEARDDEYKKAVQQTRDRDAALMGRKADVRNKMPQGFEMGAKYRGTGADLRMSIDQALDIPAPQHELAGADE